jgi:hypothetical protein
MSKITAWSKENKVNFNEEKSKSLLITRRKRKEPKHIQIYLNNKLLAQVTTIKYLGIIIDDKFKFRQHLSYAADKCAKLIHSLSRSAKLSWGLKHEAPKTIYNGAILPLLFIRRTGLDRGAEVRIQQTKLRQSSKAHKHTNG